MMHGFGWTGLGWLGWVWMGINLLLGVALVVGLVLAVVWGAKRLSGRASQDAYGLTGGSEAAAPRDILQRRYASGEITRDQYLEMKADLR